MIFAFLVIMLLFTLGLAFYLASAVYGAIRTRVPYVPTPGDDIRFLAQELSIGPSDVVFDLGSGNGRVVFGIEKASNAQVTGGEMVPFLYYLSKLKRRWYKSKARFFLGDFYSIPLHEATVIYVYLFPKLLPPLMEKIIAECRPGTIVASRDFFIEGYTPERTFPTPTGHKFLIYRV